ncbi:MAG TPA: NfeD family protein [Pseudobdellovibrionaceae bacterium]|nr:NfeD family protein [Pseudobdellovibrionaceae bacterium]
MSISALWIIAGILLVIGEMLSGGFFLLFIALGAFAGALISSLGAPFFVQASVCAVIAVAGGLLLRKPIQARLLKTMALEGDVGKELNVDQAIAPHQQTRISYQGTSWLATNLDSDPLKVGDRAVIVGIDGNILLIRKVH